LTLRNGAYFTFGAVATAPGGVANGLLTWLKADAGITVADGAAIPTWPDQSLNGYNRERAADHGETTHLSYRE